MANQCGREQDSGAPLPEDPSNDIILSAVLGLGGVEVSWNFPSINPEAVAFVNVMRSQVQTDSNPTVIGKSSGTQFFDSMDLSVVNTFFYWIQVISVKGTVLDRIGPASVTVGPSAEKIIQSISGEIKQGDLFQDLQNEIGQIDINRLDVLQEKIDRAENDDALGVQFNQVLAKADNALAAIQTEEETRVTDDLALATSIETTQTVLGDDIASVQTNTETFIDRVDGDLKDIGAEFTMKTDVNGLIGGFGVFNNGDFVEAGFNVDRFWIGRFNDTTKTFPFIVDSNQVFINTVTIQDASITDAKITDLTFNKLKNQSGNFIVNNQGEIKAENLEIDGITADWADIQNVSVSTLDIEDNAVTVPIFGSTGGSSEQIFENEKQIDVLTLSGNFNVNSPVVILVNVKVKAGSDPTNIWAIVRKTSPFNSTVGSKGSSTTANFEVTHSFMFEDIAFAGFNRWEIDLYNDWPNGFWRRRDLTVLILGAQK